MDFWFPPEPFWFCKTVADIGDIFPEIDELRRLQANTTKDIELKRISELLIELQQWCRRGVIPVQLFPGFLVKRLKTSLIKSKIIKN